MLRTWCCGGAVAATDNRTQHPADHHIHAVILTLEIGTARAKARRTRDDGSLAITIRAVAGGEADALKDVRLRALHDSPGSFTQPLAEAEAEPLGVYEERIASTARGETLNLVAENESGTFVGLAAGIPWDGRTRVVSVWVDPSVRGRGVGAELVERIASWSHEQGVDCQIEVAPGNESALQLYRRLGFEPALIEPPEGCDVVLIRRAG